MGFLLNLIILPLVVFATVALVFTAFRMKSHIPLFVLAGIWAIVIVAIVVISLFRAMDRPFRLTKNDIVGDYRIDTTLFTGKNARWQYDHFRFTIAKNDSLYFHIIAENSTTTTIKKRLVYASGPPDLWKIINDSVPYHVLKYQPTLYRGHQKFYYIFQSDFYGNMFFRKINGQRKR